MPAALSTPTARQTRRPRGAIDLAWHERTIQSVGAGTYRLCIPLIGHEPDADLAARLQRELDRRLVVPRSAAERRQVLPAHAITSLAVSIIPGDEPGSWCCALLLTVLGPVGDRRIDGPRLVRELRSALGQLAHAA